MALTYRTGFFVVSGALAISLVFHATRSGAAVPAPPPAPTASPPNASAPATTCAVELVRCREESWNVVAKSIASDLDDRARVHRSGAARPAVADPAETTGPADQKRVLCDVAEQQAREHWASQRANIHASVRDVGKPEWIKSETTKYLAKLEKDLGTTKSEHDRLERAYVTLWAKHGPILQRLVTVDPVDDLALLESVKAYWRDEDAMVENVMGSAGLAEYRAAEMRSRTAIAAILAALGDRPFDDALAW
jgi:hypothetical protein